MRTKPGLTYVGEVTTTLGVRHGVGGKGGLVALFVREADAIEYVALHEGTMLPEDTVDPVMGPVELQMLRLACRQGEPLSGALAMKLERALTITELERDLADEALKRMQPGKAPLEASVHVDPIMGNDVTAVIGDPSRPFATAEVAAEAMLKASEFGSAIITAKSPRWIPVSDRMPEIGLGVILATKCDGVVQGFWERDVDDEPQWRTMEYECVEVTHWMPLPEPPEEVPEEDDDAYDALLASHRAPGMPEVKG